MDFIILLYEFIINFLIINLITTSFISGNYLQLLPMFPVFVLMDIPYHLWLWHSRQQEKESDKTFQLLLRFFVLFLLKLYGIIPRVYITLLFLFYEPIVFLITKCLNMVCYYALINN